MHKNTTEVNETFCLPTLLKNNEANDDRSDTFRWIIPSKILFTETL